MILVREEQDYFDEFKESLIHDFRVSLKKQNSNIKLPDNDEDLLNIYEDEFETFVRSSYYDYLDEIDARSSHFRM